ncbi:hypothetical protein ENUP19_0181G0044 [Entamoeba nuttalli]|uniref:RNA pseudouridine synthase superfamily protein n=2 Tax=Entamoeba nuttalli TaxID=412467 RepID=K2H1C7_ENTNP|nr:RNA pseudouridine synthase superfamily protein [Entamoeba nuttalli P19]EKE41358.1 RNA pseudouridine synthase superfamily protein [Entamoeba nuttalli P19]|eukprot:XP_008856308.1 RNA pseudouridine synthase superfamily protein [Entamoeba nuttalli P19]
MNKENNKGIKKPRDENNIHYKNALIKKKQQIEEKRKKKEQEQLIKGISQEEINETTYYFENGLRRVLPYFYTFKVNAKGRWIGRNIVDVFVNEFKLCNEETTIKKIEKGLIKINNKIIEPSTIIHHHDEIEHQVHRHEPPVYCDKLTIVKETNDFIAIDKPSSIPVHPCGRYRHNTVIFILAHEGYPNLRPVHRLDRMTSGILLLAKTIQVAREFQSYMTIKKKEYICRVRGRLEKTIVTSKIGRKRIDDKKIHVSVNEIEEDGKECRSEFNPLFYDEKTNTTVAVALLGSGRTHQIRVHLQSIHHPIVNDPIYAAQFDESKCDDEGIFETQYGGTIQWKIEEGCIECEHLKGDPIQYGIYLHAWRYVIDDEIFETKLPYWAQPNVDISQEIDEFNKNHILI